MTQAERDRLVALKKAKKKLITQKQAAQELGITERHVRRLLRALKRRGDKAVVHALRGLPSNRKIAADTEQEAVTILRRPVYRGFGPTLASEYLAKKHSIAVSRETVRQWMIEAKLWRARKQRVEKIRLRRWQYRRGGQRPTKRLPFSGEQLRGMGLHRLMGTVKYPAQATPRRSSLSRVPENGTHGLKGDIRNGLV